jgi:uncharacterized protein
MKDLVEVLVTALVDEPDDVVIDESQRRRDTVHFRVTVRQGDLGKVIGRHGRIAHAIRTVVNAAAARQDLRAIVDFES